jgi:hypothetical protein
MSIVISTIFQVCPRIAKKIRRHLDESSYEVLSTALSASIRGVCGRFSFSFCRQIELKTIGWSPFYHQRQILSILAEVKKIGSRLQFKGPPANSDPSTWYTWKREQDMVTDRIGALMDIATSHAQHAGNGWVVERFENAIRLFWKCFPARPMVRFVCRLPGFEDYQGYGYPEPYAVRRWSKVHVRRVAVYTEANLALLFGD